MVLFTLIFSLTRFPRASIFYVYKRAATAFCVHTGLYTVFLHHDIRSEKLYQNAVNLTDSLKAKEIEARLKTRREERARTESIKVPPRGEAGEGSEDSASHGSGVKKSRKSPFWAYFQHDTARAVDGAELEKGGVQGK